MSWLSNPGGGAGKLLTVEFEGSAWGESGEKLFHWERRIYSANARRQTRVADMNVGAPSGLLEALENMTRTLGFAFARDTLALARALGTLPSRWLANVFRCLSRMNSALPVKTLSAVMPGHARLGGFRVATLEKIHPLSHELGAPTLMSADSRRLSNFGQRDASAPRMS